MKASLQTAVIVMGVVTVSGLAMLRSANAAPLFNTTSDPASVELGGKDGGMLDPLDLVVTGGKDAGATPLMAQADKGGKDAGAVGVEKADGGK